MSQKREAVNFDFISVLRFIFKWKWALLISTIISGVIAFILASPPFTDPLFRSAVTFFPASSGSISANLLSSKRLDKEGDFLTFGEEEEAEQLLQLLQSAQVTRYVKNKYNLMEHYDIDPNSKHPNYLFGQIYKSRVNFEKTRYLSIRVEVFDTDPVLAAKMASDIVSYMDSVKTLMLRKRAKQALKIVKREYKRKETFMQNMVDSLQRLGELGVMDFAEQSAALNSAYADALIAAQKGRLDRKVIDEIEQKLEVVSTLGPIHRSISERIIFELESLTDLRQRYEEAKVDAQQSMTHTFIVEDAYVPERKAKPVRSLIVLLAMIATFTFTAMVLLVVQNFQEIKSGLTEE